jgi:hypothetical protein
VKVNKLGYQITEAKNEFLPERWIELLIDDESIGHLLKTDNRAIPSYYFKTDLPSYFHHYKNRRIYILGVCSCAEAGCGHSGCELEKRDDFVTFRDIFNDGFEFPQNFEFIFFRENYDAVINEIINLEGKRKETNAIIK